jgi:hypothetical protein
MDCVEFLQFFMNIGYVGIEDEKYAIYTHVVANHAVAEKYIIENGVLEVLQVNLR